MFVPPPSKESIEIVRRSASAGPDAWRIGARLSAALVLSSAALYALLSGDNVPVASVAYVEEELSAAGFEVFQYDGIPASARDVRTVMRILDGRESQIEKENDAILRSRRPTETRVFTEKETPRLATQEPTPTLRIPQAAAPANIPSSGEWLNGDVRLGDSGLARIDQTVAVFLKGRQRVDFRVGAVLPNGEVVLQIDPASLSVRTDRRLIRIIDDGS